MIISISANGVQIGCFACYSSERACKRDIMNELGASKNINCEYCVTLYSTNEARKYTNVIMLRLY